jgi:hypothetical protein
MEINGIAQVNVLELVKFRPEFGQRLREIFKNAYAVLSSLRRVACTITGVAMEPDPG